MTALARTGKSEAFAEPRVALGVLATLIAPVAVLSFLAAATLGRLGPIGILSPLNVIVLAGSAGYLYAVSNAAFAAATQRRRARYELLTSLGAEKRHLRTVLGWELGLPAAIGIGVALLAGTALGLAYDPFGIERELDPGEGVGWQLGALTSAFYVAAPAIFGVAAAASASAGRIGRPLAPGLPNQPGLETERLTKLGLRTLAVSLSVLAVSILLFSFISVPVLEQFAFLGIALGVLGTLAGTTLLTPATLRWMNRRFFAAASSTSAVRELSSSPRRVLGISGAVLSLTALLVMVTAGFVSDQGHEDSAGDRRQIVTSPAVLDVVERLANEHGNAVLGSVAIEASQGSIIIEADQLDGHIRSVRHRNAALTPELATLLELDQDDIDFVENGGALVDSEVLGGLARWNDVTEQYEPLDTRRISRGGGIGQPGPDVYVRDDSLADDSTQIVPFDLFVRFDETISPDLQNALQSEIQARVQLPRSVENDSFRWVLTGVAAALMFSFALSSSNLTAVELEDEFSTLVALGASPNIRPRFLAAQSAWLLGLGVTAGSAIGGLLFWLVTRGDDSVPGPIVPVGTVLALAATAALATLIVRLMHGPADAALSSRPRTTVDA